MLEVSSIKLIAAHAALAIFGAVVHAARAYRMGQSRSFVDFLTLTTMASFSGVMFSLLGLYMFGDQAYLTLAMAGTGGFLGVEGMTLIAARVQDLLTLNNKK